MARARLTILLTAFFLLTGILGWESGRSAAVADKPDESYQYTLLFARVLHLIHDNYVDPGKADYKDLTYAALRGLFRWCLERELILSSPCQALTAPPRPEARDRVLSDQELREVWKAAEGLGYPFGPVIKLLNGPFRRRR